jgi:hypothetical protein
MVSQTDVVIMALLGDSLPHYQCRREPSGSNLLAAFISLVRGDYFATSLLAAAYPMIFSVSQ